MQSMPGVDILYFDPMDPNAKTVANALSPGQPVALQAGFSPITMFVCIAFSNVRMCISIKIYIYTYNIIYAHKYTYMCVCFIIQMNVYCIYVYIHTCLSVYIYV